MFSNVEYLSYFLLIHANVKISNISRFIWIWSYPRWHMIEGVIFIHLCWDYIFIYVLCFDLLTRPKMPFKVMHRKEVTHSGGSYERKSRGRKLADEMGRGKKIPLYSHRLTHRKRVTSELDDSYFRSMTITQAIPKGSGSDTSWSLDIGRRCGGVSISPRGSLKVI